MWKKFFGWEKLFCCLLGQVDVKCVFVVVFGRGKGCEICFYVGFEFSGNQVVLSNWVGECKDRFWRSGFSFVYVFKGIVDKERRGWYF